MFFSYSYIFLQPLDKPNSFRIGELIYLSSINLSKENFRGITPHIKIMIKGGVQWASREDFEE